MLIGFTGACTGRATADPPWVVRRLPLVTSLRIIVLLPLGFLSRASTVLSLALRA